MNVNNLALFTDSQRVSSSQANRVENYYRLFTKIHNHIYANDGLSPQEALNEFIKILFVKLSDERNRTQQFIYTEKLEQLFDNAKKQFPSLFHESERINLKSDTLSYIVQQLGDINLSSSEHDVKGIAFQKFLFSSQRGDRGQFFTPEPLLKMCVDFIEPKANEKILDPAAGTAGFLIEAMNYVLKKNLAAEERKIFLTSGLFGIEISPTVARIAKMRMLLAGDGHAGIINADSLSSLNNLSTKFRQQLKGWKKDIEGAFDVILTNPPFGTQGKITNQEILMDFELAYKWSSDEDPRITSTLLPGQVPEILFIERCLTLLKPGGRMAIVLPNGQFENSSLSHVRNYIKSQAHILAVVSLPPETFIPHGTGVKASIMFLKKKEKNMDGPPKIFFARVKRIGYKGDKLGTVLYKKNSHGKNLMNSEGNFIVDEDVTEVSKNYQNFKKDYRSITTENIFTVETENILDRLDVDFYSPEYTNMLNTITKKSHMKLKDVAEIIKGRSRQLKDSAAQIRYIELSDINSSSGEIVSCAKLKVHEAPSRATYEVRKDDVITAVAGNSIGTVNHVTAIVSDEYDGSVCTNGFRVFRPSLVSKEYLYTFFRSQIFLSQIQRLRTGAAIPSVSDRDLEEILVPILDDKIQKEISENIVRSNKLREKANALSQKTAKAFV